MGVFLPSPPPYLCQQGLHVKHDFAGIMRALSLHRRHDGLSWPMINDLLGNLEAIITPRSTHKLSSRIPFADLPSCYQGAPHGSRIAREIAKHFCRCRVGLIWLQSAVSGGRVYKIRSVDLAASLFQPRLGKTKSKHYCKKKKKTW